MERLVLRFGEHCLIVSEDQQEQTGLDCIFHLELQEPLKIDVGWSNGLAWTTVTLGPPLVLNQGPQTAYTSGGPPQFRIQYEAQKRFNPLYRGIMTMGRVMSVRFLGKLEDMWREFEQASGHRLVCKLRLGVGTRSCQMYLGRAQRIQTDGEHRTYTWIPRELAAVDCNDFPSPRTKDDWEVHAREARELALLKPTSPRNEPVTGFEVDHDRFENTHRVLPIVIRALDKEIQLQFFNLLTGGFVESSHIQWTGLIMKPQRRSLRGPTTATDPSNLEFKLSPQLTATVQLDGSKECVTQVTLNVEDYRNTLKKMGEGLPPKTI